MSDKPGPDLAHTAQKARTRRDAALLLPLLGVFLFASPIAMVADQGGMLFGIPTLFLYYFAAWVLLIIFSFRLARRLRDEADR